jgi:hypothetical protein
LVRRQVKDVLELEVKKLSVIKTERTLKNRTSMRDRENQCFFLFSRREQCTLNARFKLDE